MTELYDTTPPDPAPSLTVGLLAAGLGAMLWAGLTAWRWLR